MRRLLGIAIVGLMGMGLLAAPAPAAAATRAPRVVVIVGPVEGLTDDYRSIGAAAAKEAARWTTDVVSVVSPNATWPAVKRALQGASIVLYLGHGNGFPSPYRSTLFRPTEDGLGLNPVAGEGDDSHQYFGESFIASQIHLAPHAIVLMSHLCYASGNSEPGLPDPTVAVAQQRVDNFAAGWLGGRSRRGHRRHVRIAGDDDPEPLRGAERCDDDRPPVDRGAERQRPRPGVREHADPRCGGAHRPERGYVGLRPLARLAPRADGEPGHHRDRLDRAAADRPDERAPVGPVARLDRGKRRIARPRPGRDRPRSRGRHDRDARRPAVDVDHEDDAIRPRDPLAAPRSHARHR